MECMFCKRVLKDKDRIHQLYCLANPQRKSRSGSNNPHFGLSGANQYTYGATMTQATKNKCSLAREGFKHTTESKAKISTARSLNNKGGRCQWYQYPRPNGTSSNVQGTYELRFCRVLDVLDPSWIKLGVGNREHSLTYVKKGRVHTYTPDFWCPSLQKYFEVKGHWWGEDKEKMRIVQDTYSHINIEIVQLEELILYECNLGL